MKKFHDTKSIIILFICPNKWIIIYKNVTRVKCQNNWQISVTVLFDYYFVLELSNK